MAVIWNEKRADGSVHIERHDYEAGTVELLDENYVPQAMKKVTPGGDGFWLSSPSNGWAGTDAQFKKMRDNEVALGIAGDVEYRPISKRGGKTAYVAKHRMKDNYIRWMKGMKRVSYDPGMGYPCPGDFRGNVPQECE